ncbi:DUF1972 domain-containing protein [Arthrobacter alpinus]|uniref:DUF1972 domain-containing protein n=1 Tax=Arthrobacter alpinus TaxID=656366 RepID=UPI001644AEEB|nr:DUF1972 domain-containing protein [Arthrobacter alpinus]
MRIALVGTRGVPAHYGGFETCVEEVGQRLVERGHSVTVYCRSSAEDEPRLDSYLGMDLVHLPALRRRSLETLSRTGLAVGHMLAHKPDVAIVFNAANAPWLPFIRAARIPVATHVDGLEWQRAKWGKIGKKYYRLAERFAVMASNALIADAQGISDYYHESLNAQTQLISYGAPLLPKLRPEYLDGLGLKPRSFHLVVARLEPENHVHVIVDGFVRSAAKLPLVVVGSAVYQKEYTQSIHDRADNRVKFLGGVWDQKLLDELYANALVYWHGHSVGGTNPSLLRAVGAGTPTNAYDVNFNTGVLGSTGRYFRSAEDVARLAEEAESTTEMLVARGNETQAVAARYNWKDVTDGYERLARSLSIGTLSSPRRAPLEPSAAETASNRGILKSRVNP